MVDKNINILLVDDSIGMRRIEKNFLLKADYTSVFEATNGLEAIDILKQEAIDLVISDLNMPEMNGLELLDYIKKDNKFKQIPFIMLTVEGIQKTMLEAIQKNVDSYIVKPIKADILLNEIETVFQSQTAKNDEII